ETGIGIDVRDAVLVLVDLALNQTRPRVVLDARVETDVEPELVLDDRTADFRTEIVLVVEVSLLVDRAAFALDDLGVGHERTGPVVAEHGAAELVRAGLRDDVDDTAGRTAKLGVVTAGDDLGLRDELVRQV